MGVITYTYNWINGKEGGIAKLMSAEYVRFCRIDRTFVIIGKIGCVCN